MMQEKTAKTRKMISWYMIEYELRNVIGNPYVHIFGVGLPIFMAWLVTTVVRSEMTDDRLFPTMSTTIYLGMSTLIPMAVILMGYAVSYAQELDKGIPERMQLFGIKSSISLCNRAISEMFFITAALIIFFCSGCLIVGIQRPTMSGLLCYLACIMLLSVIFVVLAHGIACICRGFGRTYCVSMLTYFAFMTLGGMMGITYDDLPGWTKILAKLLPITYLNRDFYQVWKGEDYNFMPLIQSYLFLGAVAGILLFIALKRPKRYPVGS